MLPPQYIWSPDKPDFNCFIDIPISLKPKDILDEFVLMCQLYPSWGVEQIIGDGDFKLASFQRAVLDMLWKTTFPLLIGSRGMGKSFILAIYALMKAVLSQDNLIGEKIIIVGSAFRQSKMVFDEIVNWIEKSPLILECAPKISNSVDKCEIKIGNSTITALPLGTGEKIRGYRASIIIADEYAQIPEEIFQVVVRGFAAVSQHPVKRSEMVAQLKALKEAGLIPQDAKDPTEKKNQTILSSTSFYKFNHLYTTYSKYKTVIENKMLGNIGDYKDILGEKVADGNIDYRDFAICRLPYTEIPEGFLDSTQLAQARLTMSDERFRMEFMAEFVDDTEGFFKRSHMEECTPSFISRNGKNILNPEAFAVELFGDGLSTYVMGIDPARSSDNFAIAIIKIFQGKMYLVYMITFNRKDFITISKTVRELVRKFDIKSIGVDKGGGGQTFADILANKELAEDENSLRIFEKDNEEFENIVGMHMLELIKYQGEWLYNANYDLQADIDPLHKRLLFPYTHNDDKYMDDEGNFNVNEVLAVGDVFKEIQEAKEEISAIIMTTTGKSETPHFDLPDIGKNPYDVRRKDRYSAVLIAADQARKIIIGDTLIMDDQSRHGDLGGWLEDFQ